VNHAESSVAVALREVTQLVRLAGKRANPATELSAKDLATLPGTVRFEAMQAVGQQIFLGDSEWFTKRFQMRFPEKEKRAAAKP
jgi:hypothetical protein